jgi:hypothetical protein
MRDNTPPHSPYRNDDEELVYVGDDIDEVIQHLEEIPDDEEDDDYAEGKISISQPFYTHN